MQTGILSNFFDCALDYGTDRIIGIKNQIPATVSPTIDLVRSYLDGPVSNGVISVATDISVDNVDLSAYDAKFKVAVNG